MVKLPSFRVDASTLQREKDQASADARNEVMMSENRETSLRHWPMIPP
jgi:hypothetical protein